MCWPAIRIASAWSRWPARQNAAKLAQQVIQWKPDVAVLADERALPELKERLARANVTGTADAGW